MRRFALLLVVASGAAAAPRQDATYRSRTDVVEIDAAVTVGGRQVTGLAAGDFDVTDNGVRQTVLSVLSETVPIDLTLVIDVSGSIDTRLQEAIGRAIARVGARLRPTDRVSVLTFNQRVRERVPLRPATGLNIAGLLAGSGQTSLNDAIAVALVAPVEQGRRQMALVFTDGMDTMSFLDPEIVRDVAGRSRTALFVGEHVSDTLWRQVPEARSLACVARPMARVLKGDNTQRRENASVRLQ
jgi:hypothetical protein